MQIAFKKATKSLSKKIDSLPHTKLDEILPDEIRKAMAVLKIKQRSRLLGCLSSIISQKATQEGDLPSLKAWLLNGAVQDLRGKNLPFSKIVDLSKKIYALNEKIKEQKKKKLKSSQHEDDLEEKINVLLGYAELIDRELYFR